MTFEALKLTRQFLNAVEDAGYKEPTPIQKLAIPPLRSGQDVIGIAQTGTGFACLVNTRVAYLAS